MIDNFDIIRPLLKFEDEDQFYFLQIIQRKKDHNGNVNGTNNNSRLIKAYYIKSLDHFDFIKEEVIKLCEIFNARAGINLNRRSFEKTAYQNLIMTTNHIMNKQFDKVYKSYNSVCGKFNKESDKRWIIDIDEDQIHLVDDIEDIITNTQPIGNKVICKIPSKSGYHLITKPFNIKEFKEEIIGIEIHKNNPTNLYIP